jgi:hypothetical protein
MSSELQFEHTGVERATRPVRLSTAGGVAVIRLNGLISNALCMGFASPLLLILEASLYPGNCVPKAVKF